MKLRTRGKDYVFMINNNQVLVCYNGKKEIVIEIAVFDGKMFIKTEARNNMIKELKSLPIDSLEFSVKFETKSGIVYKIKECEKHLMLFHDNEFFGEIERISGLNGKGTIEILLKKLTSTSLKFHI